MVIVPDSRIKLIKNPLKLDSNNEIMFNSKNEQYNYFNSLPKLEFENLTYIRKDGILRIETDDNLTYEDLLGYNFCMYQNSHFDNKWFYAFITDITWINPGLTEMKLETAYYQTWQFDLIYKDSFIEREHVNNDTIGLHTLYENVETGEYLPMDKSYISYQLPGLNDFYVCVGVTDNIMDNTFGIGFYGGVPCGIQYIVIKDEDITLFLDFYAQSGRSDTIESIFMIPGGMVNGGESFTWLTYQYNSSTIHYFKPSPVSSTLLGEVNISRPNQLGISQNKYTPKNKKLLTGQFNFIMGDNLVGGTAPYYYEYFYDPSACNFKCNGVLTPGCSIKCYPTSYKYTYDSGIIIDNSSFSEGLMASKLPVGSWVKDTYTNWLTQNGVNIPINIATSGINALAGIASNGVEGNATGVITSTTSGISGVGGAIASIYEHSFLPNQVQGNTNSGDVTFAVYKSVMMYYRMTIKEEFARSIDSYFSMFGYKVNRLGLPHLHVRTYYDYIKTIDVNIEGDIPEPDLNQIRSMFNNGIRFWHSTANYLNFNVNNNIIS